MTVRARPSLQMKLPAVIALLLASSGADWPHWMGPNCNGSSPETGLLTAWPAQGPKVLWKVEGGEGYSSIAVVGGRAFTMVQRGADELVLALDTATSKELWKTRSGPAYKNEFGNGPRSTPAVDGNRVYAQSVTGPMLCLEADTGKVVWEHNLLKEFGAENLRWGLSASPVVDGDLVFVIPGAKGAGVVAYRKQTGALAWKAGNDKAAYASPTCLTLDGERQALFFTAPGLLCVTADTGKELWRLSWVTDFDVNICTPLLIGNDRLFVASGEKVGCALFKLPPGPAPPRLIWESKGTKSVMKNYWATAVAHEGYLYGLSGEFESVINFNCVELDTGNLVWSKERFGKASVTLADGHLFITTKSGDLVLAPATPKGYDEKARIKLLGDNRTVPTIANKRLYLRDRKNIFCLDIAAMGQ